MLGSRKARLFAATCGAAVALATAAAPALAQPQTNVTQQTGGAAGLVAAVVQADVADVNVLIQDSFNDNFDNVEIITVKDSFKNFLNRNEVLNDNDVDILTNFLNNANCSVVAACDSFQDFLNDNNVVITDVVAIDVLSGDLVIFVFPQ
jgi:hypothetical protein